MNNRMYKILNFYRETKCKKAVEPSNRKEYCLISIIPYGSRATYGYSILIDGKCTSYTPTGVSSSQLTEHEFITSYAFGLRITKIDKVKFLMKQLNKEVLRDSIV